MWHSYLLIDTLILAICAVIYSKILLDRGMIFESLSDKLITLPDWIGKPLGLCYICVSGQMAFWYFLIFKLNVQNILLIIPFICITIFFALIINKIVEWSLSN